MSHITQQSEKKRYVVTVSFYMEAESDRDVMHKATDYAYQLNKEHDCRATVESITQSQFGKLGTRKVF